MGRWAQAQRRGTARNAATVLSPPGESSFAISWSGDSADAVLVTAVFSVPPGIDEFFWQVSAIATPGIIAGDGDDGFPPPDKDTGFLIPASDVYQIRFAWGTAAGGIQSAYGPWLSIEA